MRTRWREAFFAVSACSWMPHWACHFYRLETHSTFIVGSWSFTPLDSMIAMAVYSLLVVSNIAAVVEPRLRFGVGVISGALHLCFAALHVVRMVRPFRFEVIGHPWPLSSSGREVAIVGLFGIATIFVAASALRATPRRSLHG